MILSEKKKRINGIELIYVSTDSASQFVCDCCGNNKIAKKYALIKSDSRNSLTVCNACYGTLLSDSSHSFWNRLCKTTVPEPVKNTDSQTPTNCLTSYVNSEPEGEKRATSTTRQPEWNKYEAAILLEAVNNVYRGKESRKDAVKRVSSLLRQMAINQGKEIDDIYRNINGISFQFQSMENAAFGTVGLTNKTGTKLFFEIVELSHSNKEEYSSVLSRAHMLASTSNDSNDSNDIIVSNKENSTSNKDSFRVWLSEHGFKDQTIEWIISSFEKLSLLAKQRKITSVIIWDIQEIRQYQLFVNAVQSNKWFRVIERTLFNFLLKNHKLYADYLRTKKAQKRTVDIDSFAEDYCEEDYVITEYDEKLYLTYGDALLRVYHILKQEKKHVYLSVEQISKVCSLTEEAAKEILSHASWSERLGDGYIFGKNNTVGDKNQSFCIDRSFDIPTKIETIICEHFRRGFKPSSIMDKNRFKSVYVDKYNEEIGIEEIVSEIQKSCFVFDNRYFLPKAIISKDNMQKIVDYMADYFINNDILFYDVLYNQFEDDFSSFVYSSEMLVELLKKVISGTPLYYFDRYCSTKAEANPDLASEVSNYLIEMDVPCSYEMIYERFLHYNQKDVYDVIHYNSPEILGNSKNEYFHIKAAHITDGELSVIQSVVCTLLQNSRYITCNEVMINLNRSNHEIMDRLSAKFSVLGIRRIFSYYLRTLFDVNTGIITNKGQKMTVDEAFADFAKTHDRFTVNDVQDFAEYIGTVPYWDPIHTYAVRINATEFVSDGSIDFNVDAIDAAINYYCSDYTTLIGVTDYSRFPSCGTTWNIFLLQQYVFRFSQQFKLLSLGFSKGNASGVIVSKQSGFEDFDSVVVDALEKTSITTPNDAIQYLCDKGFISERRYKKHADLLKMAIVQRNNK